MVGSYISRLTLWFLEMFKFAKIELNLKVAYTTANSGYDRLENYSEGFLLLLKLRSCAPTRCYSVATKLIFKRVAARVLPIHRSAAHRMNESHGLRSQGMPLRYKTSLNPITILIKVNKKVVPRFQNDTT